MPWGAIGGALIGAGAKLIPQLFGDGSDQKAESQFNANFELQQRMAEHGTLIRARDVMRAYAETGIHPLSLMGMNPASASSVASVGGGSGGNWRRGVADAGQDIGRALAATSGQEERGALAKLAIERGGLENELLRVKTAREVQELQRGAQIGPALPIGNPNRYLVDGQGDANTELRSPMGRSNLVVDQPLKRTVSDPNSMSNEPGAVTGVRWSRTPTGYMPIKSKDSQEGLEDDWIGNLWWNANHRLRPLIQSMARYPMSNVPFKAPEGKRWYFDGLTGEYRLTDTRRYTAGEAPIKYR